MLHRMVWSSKPTDVYFCVPLTKACRLPMVAYSIEAEGVLLVESVLPRTSGAVGKVGTVRKELYIDSRTRQFSSP